MKKNRQEVILELVASHNIETQEELIRLLAEKGYTVTKATASRDIRELKLTKSTEGKQGSYHYVLPKTLNPSQVHFNKTIVQSITGVDYWGNLVVLKTIPGLASAVAASVDALNIPQIMGCVAGDDTILVAVRGDDCAKEIGNKIHTLILGG